MEQVKTTDGNPISGVVWAVVFEAIIVAAVLLLTGCGVTTGWEVSFGAHPITAVHDESGLNRQELDRRGEFSTVAPRM